VVTPGQYKKALLFAGLAIQNNLNLPQNGRLFILRVKVVTANYRDSEERAEGQFCARTGAAFVSGRVGRLNLLGVIGANMGRKLLVALQLEVSRHFIERCAGQGFRRFEAPATFRTTKTPKTLLLNPHQLPAHGAQILQAANLDGLSGILQKPCVWRCILQRVARIREFLFRATRRVSRSPRAGGFSVSLARGAQGTPNRAVWRADEWRRKASRQQNPSIHLR